jgi:hypothetical protein
MTVTIDLPQWLNVRFCRDPRDRADAPSSEIYRRTVML